MVVGAAEVVELTVGVPAGEVAGAVQALAVVGGGEAGGGEAGSGDVAVGELDSAEVELAGDADGDGAEPGVQNMDGRCDDRPTDRHGRRLGELAFLQVVAGDFDGCFGGAVGVPHLNVGAYQFPGEGDGECFAADGEGAELGVCEGESGVEHGV